VIKFIKPVLFALAIVYFMVDAVFMSVARPLARWLAEQPLLNNLRVWIASLRPYPTLALFVVPFIVLEPVKLLAVYLIGTGRFLVGTTVFVIGEILKLVLVERLFDLSRDKLLSIPIFAWGYQLWRWAIDAVKATEIFRNARAVMVLTRLFIRNAFQIAASRKHIVRRGKGRAAPQSLGYENALRPIPVRAARPSRYY
jgi:hypothetical protein